MHVVCSVEPGGGNVRVSIVDTGIGIPPDLLPHMFEVYNRLGQERTQVQGAGIGLVISKGLVEAMQGSVGVHSLQDKGTTVWIEIPLAGDEESLVRRVLNAQLQAVVMPRNENTRPWTVLYIEDNGVNLELVERMVARHPQLVLISVLTGKEGLTLAPTLQPDLILLDINLPDFNGHEVLKQMRCMDALKHTPIVAVSADALPHEISRAIEAGFNAYLTKPIKIVEFDNAVCSALTAMRNQGR
ncbi:MAG: response regulator [Gammaproteobacteria bacterium]|nr:response regulator [Gammaproteobacteria bacterium]